MKRYVCSSSLNSKFALVAWSKKNTRAWTFSSRSTKSDFHPAKKNGADVPKIAPGNHFQLLIRER